MNLVHPNFLRSMLIFASAWSPIANAANPLATHSSSEETTTPTLAPSPSLNAEGAPCNPQVLSAVYAHMMRIRRNHSSQRNTNLVPLYLELIHWRRTPAPSIEEMNQLVGNVVAEGSNPYLELKFSEPFPKVVRYVFSANNQGLHLDGAMSGTESLCKAQDLDQASPLNASPLQFDSSVLTLPKAIANGSARITDVDQKCLSEIKKIYASNGNLSSQALKKRALPLAAWNSKYSVPSHDLLFFHYTKASKELSQIVHANIVDRGQAQLKNFEERSYDGIFSYLYARYDYTYLKTHYLAADGRSSDTYGPYLVIFELDPRTPVLDIQLATDQWPKILDELKAELTTRYPKLKSCSFKKDFVGTDLMYMLAAEDSGIGLLAYYHPTEMTPTTWYKLLDSRYITNSSGRMTQ